MKNLSGFRALSCALLMSIMPFTTASAQQAISLANLSPGQTASGFRAVALYLNDADQPMGARFVHQRTGFIFDYVQIQSLPQTFIWVNSFPTSDMGEPHTQEHLLLGKGNKGRYVASLEEMSLTESSAYTMQWRTCYHSNTNAGPDVFYRVFQAQLDALLHPDYTDEEISREVANFGVDESPTDRTMRLEEKGTVYNEMVSTFERPWSRMMRELGISLYGADHPLAYESGGLPSALRVLKPADIRKFHHANYHLGNMGMVGSFPKKMKLGDILLHVNEILNSVQPESETRGRKATTEADLPAPKLAAPGTITVADYPNKNADQPSPIIFGWLPNVEFDVMENELLDLFVSNIAGDATTNLYKRFIDSKTRTIDVGATSVFGWTSSDQGHPVFIGLDDVEPSKLTDAKLDAIRRQIVDEIAHIASLPDNSPELIEFNKRIASRITETRRSMSKFVNSPPGFGFRNASSEWMGQLHLLERSKEFRKSVTLKPELDRIEKMVAGGKNVWREYLKKWKLAGTIPYAAIARPNPDLVEREAKERSGRIAAEVARLKASYNAASEQEAISRYSSDYDAATRQLDSIARLVPTPHFVANPPLTLDDELEYHTSKLSRGVPLVTSVFDNMTSATIGVALRLDGIPEDELPYLSLLPALLTQTGVIENGKPISYEEMSERLRTEVLGLSAYFSSSFATGRCELVIRGAGNDLAESKRSIEWMKLALLHSNWSGENLPRIRDLVDQAASELQNTMQGSEESWVNDPAAAYWRQDNPLLLATQSFLTKAHNAFRLKWLLKDAGSDRESIGTFLDHLAGAVDPAIAMNDSTRAELKTLLAVLGGDSTNVEKVAARYKRWRDELNRLPEGGRSIAREAVQDLALNLTGVPDESLAADWKQLCSEMKRDLLVSPAQVLAQLNDLRDRIARSANARAFMIGSSASIEALKKEADGIVSDLSTKPAEHVTYSKTPLVISRLRDRITASEKPLFVGLVNPNTGSGVFVNSAAAAGYHDTDRESLLQFLSAMLYSGHGAHGIFMKTWASGLAYSNGIRISPRSGRISYYAERCPALPQTMRFVIGELKNVARDSSLVEYAVAQAFAETRAASTYESRGESIAADLADSLPPEVVSRFRTAVLALRSESHLTEALYDRMPSTYGKVLPGFGPKSRDVAGGVFFVIGPEKQMALYEEYLRSVEGAGAKLYRIYPRDFWMVGEEQRAKSD
jgi:Zn-dependent M16 (insulinase) family peptidase